MELPKKQLVGLSGHILVIQSGTKVEDLCWLHERNENEIALNKVPFRGFNSFDCRLELFSFGQQRGLPAPDGRHFYRK